MNASIGILGNEMKDFADAVAETARTRMTVVRWESGFGVFAE